jgi:hypothetical protein
MKGEQMILKRGCSFIFALLCLQMLFAAPSIAGEYSVSDISLVPGADETRLNITWHAGTGTEGEDTCKVKVAKKSSFLFPSISTVFTGATGSAGVDETGAADYYCEVDISGLEADTEYVYRLGDGNGNWSDTYEYTSRNGNAFSFFFVADSQIGASAPDPLSKSRDIKPYIAEYKTKSTFPTLTDEEVETIVDAYTGGTLADLTTEPYASLDLTTLGTSIDTLYNALKDEYDAEGYLTDLEALTAQDATLAGEVLALIEANTVERKADVAEDTTGWSETIGIMSEQFPEAAFLLSSGDQVEEPDIEYEYTGLFAPQELTSLPMAPTIGSHDRAVNFDYHFNLPNESEYGVNDAGGDYYFTYGNALIMVLNMDATGQAFPKSPPPGAPPGGPGGPGGPPPGMDDPSDDTDTDGDGVGDDDDLCPAIYGESVNGCPLTAEYDDDGDGVTNEVDMCSNTLAAHYEAGLISAVDGCPYSDVDSDGIPDEDADGNIIDRCNNTYDDLTVDEEGCADCDYLETEYELADMIYDLENSCETDELTDIETCTDELADYKASLDEHRTFMENAIAANPDAKWKIVMWHYSCYSAGMHSTDDELEVLRYKFTPVLEALDIDVVLMGHDHVYTRTFQMQGNLPQLTQTETDDGRVVNPTGVLYLTASSSSGSKFYTLNCNIGDESSDSVSYYDYADSWYDQIRTFTHFTIDGDSLDLKTYTYTLGDTVGSYDTVLIDEYAILSDPSYQADTDDGDDTPDSDSSGTCFISSASSTPAAGAVTACIALMAITGIFLLTPRKKSNRQS